MKCLCAHCGKETDKTVSHINRATKEGRRLFCGRVCFGLDRRVEKDKEQKVAEKRAYDMAYREKNRAMLKAKKAAWFQREYDPVAAAVYRKARMPLHVEYCRRPEYKILKRAYDEKLRAKKSVGEYWEAFLLVMQLDKEIASRATKQEIAIVNGTLNKSQTRRRAL